jgi:hypothetical protein
MRPWVLTRPYLNKYRLVSRPVECLHGPQVPSRTLELLVALLVQTQHVTPFDLVNEPRKIVHGVDTKRILEHRPDFVPHNNDGSSKGKDMGVCQISRSSAQVIKRVYWGPL